MQFHLFLVTNQRLQNDEDFDSLQSGEDPADRFWLKQCDCTPSMEIFKTWHQAPFCQGTIPVFIDSNKIVWGVVYHEAKVSLTKEKHSSELLTY